MAKKKSLIIFFICLLIVLLFVVALCFLVYSAKTVPAFNNFIDIVFLNKIEKNSTENTSLQQQVEDQLLNAGTSVAGLIPVLSVLSEPVEYTLDGTDLLLQQTVSVTEQGFQIICSDKDWQIQLEIPVVTKPGVFADVVVFVDASSNFVLLDRNTGNKLASIPCMIYPAIQGESYCIEKTYYFASRAGTMAKIDFSESGSLPLFLEPQSINFPLVSDFSSAMQEFVYPTAELYSQISAKMNTLLAINPPISISTALLYAESHNVIPLSHEQFSSVVIFSPEESANYTLGLCDKNGNWIKGSMFVTLFNKTGESLAISLDYVADRPQVTMHLSDNQLYYICAGFMDTEVDASFVVKKVP